MRYSNNSTHLLINPSIFAIEQWTYSSPETQTYSSACHALQTFSAFANAANAMSFVSHQRPRLLIMMVNNPPMDFPCAIHNENNEYSDVNQLLLDEHVIQQSYIIFFDNMENSDSHDFDGISFTNNFQLFSTDLVVINFVVASVCEYACETNDGYMD